MNRNLIGKLLIFLGMLSITATFVYPILFLLLNSFKTNVDYMVNPFSIPLTNLSLDNYGIMIGSFKIFRLFLNTAIVVISSQILITVISIQVSYAVAKLNFPGKNFMYMMILGLMIIPPSVTVIPVYIMFSKIGLINNFLSMIIYYIGFSCGAIFLMTSYFRSIPEELLNAAKIDGCGYLGSIFNVVIPVGLPAIVINIVFVSVMMWNDLLIPMLFLTDENKRMIMPALANLISANKRASEPTLQIAGLFLATIPTIILYIFLQKQIVKGMVSGAIK